MPQSYDLKEICAKIDRLQDPSPDELRYAYQKLNEAVVILEQMGPKYSLAVGGMHYTINSIREVMHSMREPLILSA